MAWSGEAFLDVLATFEPSSKRLLAARALQHRVDRKYLVPAWIVGPLLARLHAGHRVVESGEKRLACYEDLYFDTAERRLYHDHHRGRRPRYKVRIRHHVDRQRTFLEVKRKGLDDRTTKARLELPFRRTELDVEGRRFVEAHAPIHAVLLVPGVSIAFLRATLVATDVDERLTFDWRVEFGHASRRGRLRGAVIAEVKQARYRNTGGAVDAFRALHVREQGVSKYCLATSRFEAVRTNRFRPALRAVEQMATWETS